MARNARQGEFLPNVFASTPFFFKDGIMANLLSLIRPFQRRMQGVAARHATPCARPLRIYRDPSHIVMVGSIHDICLKLEQSAAERYCHIDA